MISNIFSSRADVLFENSTWKIFFSSGVFSKKVKYLNFGEKKMFMRKDAKEQKRLKRVGKNSSESHENIF